MTAPAHAEGKGADIAFDGVSFWYPDTGRARVLDGIDLRVEHGERLGVLGPNGGGKTTLVKLILGLLEPSEGSVRVAGMTPDRARGRGLIGTVEQRSGAERSFPIAVRDAVALGASWKLRGTARLSSDANARAERALTLTGAADFADKPIGRLSGGQFQRAMIARALAPEPRVLLLDEPTVGIDVAGQAAFGEMLDRIQGELGTTIVVVTHDLRAIAAGCDRVACVSRTLHAHTAPSGLTPGVLAEVFRHEIEGVFGALHLDAHTAAECDDPTHASEAHEHAHDHGCCQHSKPPGAAGTSDPDEDAP